MIVRSEQLAALGRVREAQFIGEMVIHLRSHFPREVAELDDDGLRARIEASLSRARGYALSSKQDCIRFLNLCASFGWNFDQEPSRPWIGEYLRDVEIESPSERLRRVSSRCLRDLKLEENNRKARASLGGAP